MPIETASHAAAIAAFLSNLAEEGLVIVPKEATDEMADAAQRRLHKGDLVYSGALGVVSHDRGRPEVTFDPATIMEARRLAYSEVYAMERAQFSDLEWKKVEAVLHRHANALVN